MFDIRNTAMKTMVKGSICQTLLSTVHVVTVWQTYKFFLKANHV